MPKPTMMQTLLGRPSRTYAAPSPQRDYLSAKHDTHRVSAEPLAVSSVRSSLDSGYFDPMLARPAGTVPSRTPSKKRLAPYATSDMDGASRPIPLTAPMSQPPSTSALHTPESSGRTSLDSHEGRDARYGFEQQERPRPSSAHKDYYSAKEDMIRAASGADTQPGGSGRNSVDSHESSDATHGIRISGVTSHFPAQTSSGVPRRPSKRQYAPFAVFAQAAVLDRTSARSTPLTMSHSRDVLLEPRSIERPSLQSSVPSSDAPYHPDSMTGHTSDAGRSRSRSPAHSDMATEDMHEHSSGAPKPALPPKPQGLAASSRSAPVRHPRASREAPPGHAWLQDRPSGPGATAPAPASPAAISRDDSRGSKTSSDEDGDVFYTPLTSPLPSPHTSMVLSQDSLAAFMPPPHACALASSAMSVSSTQSDDGDSVSVYSSTSSHLHSNSTHITTPSSSDAGKHHTYTTTTITIASSSKLPRSQGAPFASDVIGVHGAGWTKDVRWLSTPASIPAHPPGRLGAAPSRVMLPHARTFPPASLPLHAHPQQHPMMRQQASVRRGGPPRAKSERQRRPRKRMSAVFEDDEDEAERPTSPGSGPGSVSGGAGSASGLGPKPNSPLSRSVSLPPRTSPRTHARHLSAASVTSDLPTPMPTAGPGADAYGPGGGGYTNLVLPRAAYVPNAHAAGRLASGRVDLTRSGLAQTTMATVEVVRGIAGRARSVRRQLSFSLRPGSSGGVRRKSEDSAAERTGTEGRENVDEEEADALAFTSHVPPPTYVPSSSVLVQVCAVGLDGTDAALVRERIGEKGKGKASAVGFVPGRSFVGRAVECGNEVREDAVRKGDWVVGLLDIKKCGALAEFVVIDRRRVHKVTHPVPSTLGAGSQGSMTPRGATLEELALLPLSGVAAYRGTRTFGHEPIAGRSLRRPRVLVLQAQDGPGALAVQMLWARGMRVCVQVPHGGGLVAPPIHGRTDADARQANELAAVARARACGAEEVCAGPPLAVLEQLRRRGDRFDFVLDTVGGRDVWEASRALLAAPAPGEEDGEGGAGAVERQFTTLVGDAPERPVPSVQDHFWAGMRSLGIGRGKSTPADRAGGEAGKDSKLGRGAGYAWVSVAADVDWAGEDVRDSLAGLVGMMENGTIMPCIDGGGGAAENPSKVVTFERAPEVFRGAGRLKEGRTVVVKIVG